MPTETIRFPGARGAEIAARLDSPAGPPRAYALFAHCFTCSKDSKAAAYVSQALAGQGIATLRFDFSSLEFSSNIDDLIAAADWLRRNRAAPQILAGHSLGGAAVLAAAARFPRRALLQRSVRRSSPLMYPICFLLQLMKSLPREKQASISAAGRCALAGSSSTT